MAVDAAQADVDEPGAASQLKGLKQCFTDSKVYVLALAYVRTLWKMACWDFDG